VSRLLWKFIAACCLLSFLALPSPVLADGHFRLPAQAIQLYINKDGSFDCVDTRSFAGTSDEEITIDISGSDIPGTLSDITVSEMAQSYRKIDPSERLIPGTYQEELSGDPSVRIVLRPFSNTDPSVTLSYQVNGGIVRYLDGADLRWSAGTTGGALPGSLTISVTLPEAIPGQEVDSWMHFADRISTSFESDQTMLINASWISADAPLTFRTLFPTEEVTGDIIPMTVRGSILAQESELQLRHLDSQKKRAIQKQLRVLYFFLFQPLVLGGWLFWFYREYTKAGKRRTRFDVVHEDIWSTSLPDREPADIPFLFGVQKEKLRTLTVISTFFDLARRGYLRIEEEKKVMAGLHDASHTTALYLVRLQKTTSIDQSTGQETELLEILFPDQESSGRYAFAEMISHLGKQRRRIMAWTLQGKKSSSRMLKSPVESTSVTRWLYLSAGLLLLVGSPVIIPAVILLPLIKKPASPVSEDEHKQWLTFQAALCDLSKLSHAPPPSLVERWERYFPLSIACDAADGLIHLLPEILARSIRMPTWFVRSGEMSFNTADIAGFASRIRFLILQMTAALEPGKQNKQNNK